MSIISEIASSAVAAYITKQAVTANNLANINTPDFKSSNAVMKETKGGGVIADIVQGSDSVDISREAVDMMMTSNNYSAILKTFKVADTMMKNVLDILK